MPRVLRPRHRLAATVAAVLAVLVGPAPVNAAGPVSADADMPTSTEWLADVAQAMDGSQRYVDRRAGYGRRLAVNLDIDNTSLATYYQEGAAIRVVRGFARNAEANGVAVLFNTGRVVGDGRLIRAKRQLVAAGYHVTGICGRSRPSEPLAASKQRCRQHFVDKGYRIIANVGNRATDFTGGNYERAYRLPNYGNQLG